MKVNYQWLNYQWHNAPNELPDCDCVCVTFYNGGYHINCWNNYHQCWDDEDGDDMEWSKNKPLAWMILENDK